MKTSSTIYITLFLCLLLFPSTLKSQDSIQYRKLYLHTDREQYFLGDTIWYKAYYLDGQSNKFIPGLITMYVDVIDDQGTSVIDQVPAIDNGAAAGAMDIPMDLDPGNYMIRAYTDFQKLIGEDAFFYKQVEISKLESFVEDTKQPEQILVEEIYLDFMPEGGMLLEGQMNTLALKATDEHGKGVPVEGEILDSKGNLVTSFKSSYKGMGSFSFTPKKGESYTARTAAYPDFHHRFTDIVKEGIKIEFEEDVRDELHFRVLTNASSFIGRTFYFAISHHGDVIFYKKFIPKKDIFPITVNKDALPAGINKMVLLDEQLIPISERLFFSSNFQINEIKIKADKQSYKTRSRVRLKLSDGPGTDNQSWSNLSMAVVDEFASNKEAPSINILSWLLIDSELRGHIESPIDCFSNDPGTASTSKLDLLMMTQGWSRYIWNDPREYLASKSKEKEGFCLSGEVNKVVGKKPVTDGTVELKVYSNDFMHTDEVKLDEEGKFVFEAVNFMDSVSVFIQARNKNERLAFKVSLDPVFHNFSMVSAEHLPKYESAVPKQAELYQKQYDNLQALKEYTLKTGGFYIEEVTIVDYKREKDDGHFRIYPKPSNSTEITNRDLTYTSVIDYIQGRFSGVTVTSNKNIIIRGRSRLGTGTSMNEQFTANSTEGNDPGPGRQEEHASALLLLDGLPVSKDVFLSIPMSDIDKVEILKNISETAIFGVRGGGGVVSVFTKRGGAPDYTDKYIPGTIAEKLAGYSSSREFYTPKYTDENIGSERPDHRIVQYWDPDIFTEKGKATVNFFSSDDITRYKVYVEGITNEGKICQGTAVIVVDQKNERLNRK